jgi:hypothetical protein
MGAKRVRPGMYLYQGHTVAVTPGGRWTVTNFGETFTSKREALTGVDRLEYLPDPIVRVLRRGLQARVDRLCRQLGGS